MNTSKYKGMKRMNDTMHKLLDNKSKIQEMIQNLYSESESIESSSSSAKDGDDEISPEGPDAIAKQNTVDKSAKSKGIKKSNSGREPSEKARS